ncbi:MAG: 50S ribosome-binding GTPase, partial [Phascolarctobacterium sp.]|nr:50S ribosome-binding GTPase [Phascolarctobacterium sp.]
QQNGQLAKALRGLRTDLVDIIVNLEAVIDYPEEDIEDVTFNKVQESITNSCDKIHYLLAHAHTGKILREGLRTAIVGRPNVGKSSLLNALLKEDRAIVSEYAGTTRDVIEEQLLLDGVPLVLADTAGIRQTDDFVEAIGVERSKQHLQDAELVICVVDGSEKLTPEDEDILEAAQSKPHVIIVNKSDKDIHDNFVALQERLVKNKLWRFLLKLPKALTNLLLGLKTSFMVAKVL